MDQLTTLITNLNKKLGAGTVMRLSDQPMEMPRFSSGSVALDIALGGGVPEGRIVEVYGPESSGKTTAAYHMAVGAQRKHPDKAVIYIDGEHVFDPVYAAAIGLDLSDGRFVISQPNTLEEALTVVDEAAGSDIVSLVILDSTNSLPARAEIEGEMGAAHVGLAARLFSQALRKVSGKLRKNGVTWIMVSQLRQKIGITFGSDEVIGVGNAIKFYASIRLNCRRIATEKESGDPRAIRTRFQVKKNKTAPPLQEAEVSIEFGKGFDLLRELIEYGVQLGIITKNGAWYKWPDPETGELFAAGQGINNFQAEFDQEKTVALKTVVYERIFGPTE